MPADIPAKIGPYEVRRELGRGGMGVVYRARDAALARDVALKVLAADSPLSLCERFLREGRLAARLRHPHIVAIHSAGEADGVAYLAQELIEGQSLAAALAGETMAPERAAAIVQSVAEALAYAHAQGVIHRDVKPGNILLDAAGQPHLADFGLAREVAGGAALSRSGEAVGTPLYMAPEQIVGPADRMDGRVDVWACGVVLFECLAGSTPFEGATSVAVMAAVVSEDPRPLAALVPGCPRDLVTVVERCLEKSAARRYPTAQALAEDLGRWRRGEAVRARPAGAGRRFARRLARRPVWVAAAAAAVLALGAAAVVVGPRLTAAEGAALARLREVTSGALEAALDLRRANDLPGMRKHAARVEQACREALAAAPGSPEPHYRLGRMWRALMRDEEALAAQARALAADPGFAPARYERAVLTARRFRARVTDVLDEAWQALGARLARAGGGTVEADAGLAVPDGTALVAADPEARAWRDQLAGDAAALAAAPDAVPARVACARGLLALVEARFDAGATDLAAAVAADAGLEEAHEGLAVAHELAGRYAEAVDAWTAGAARDRGYVRHLEGRGATRMAWARAARLHGDDARETARAAVADFDAALAVVPERLASLLGRVRARRVLADALAAHGADPRAVLGDALADADTAVALVPTAPAPYALRAAVRAELALDLAETRDPAALSAVLADCDAALRAGATAAVLFRIRGTVHATRVLDAIEVGRTLEADAEAALADFDEALRRHPAEPENWVVRGALRAKLASRQAVAGAEPRAAFAAALRDLDEAARLSPSRPYHRERILVRTELANRLLDVRADAAPVFQEALAEAEALVVEWPNDPTGLWLRGAVLAARARGTAAAGGDAQPDTEVAIQSLNGALALAPTFHAALVDRGLLLAGEVERGARRGAAAREALDTVAADLRAALAVHPDDWRAARGLALGLARAGELAQDAGEDAAARFREALQVVDAAASRWPTVADVAVARGRVHQIRAMAAGRAGEATRDSYQAALDAFDAAERLGPLDASVHADRASTALNLANALVRGGADGESLYLRALADFEAADRKRPEDAVILTSLGAAHASLAVRAAARDEDPGPHFARALAALDRAVALRPDLAPGWVYRGRAHATWAGLRARRAEPVGTHWDEAVASFEAAIRADPAREAALAADLAEARERLGGAGGR